MAFKDAVKLQGGIAAIITEKAILYHTPIFPNTTIQVWFPKSASAIDPDDQILWVERWLLEKKEKELNEVILVKEQFKRTEEL